MKNDPIANVRAFYERTAPYENQRLDENFYRRLELDVTVHFVQKFVTPGARILDIGGGPGRYLDILTPMDYDCWLVDLSPANVTLARARAERLKLSPLDQRVRVADARDLSAFEEGEFDAALMLGPFYHLVNQQDQRRALMESVRVVKPGGLLFLAILPRLHPLRYLLRECSPMSRRYLFSIGWGKYLRTGYYQNILAPECDDPTFFTDSFFWEIPAFSTFLTEAGCVVEIIFGAESFCGFFDVPITEILRNEKDYQHLLKLVLKTCTHPESLAISEHVVAVARTPSERKRRKQSVNQRR